MFKKHKFNLAKLILVSGLFGLFFLVGCSQEQNSAKVQISEEGYQVTDARGRVVKLKHKPQRIVSLTYGTDEIIAEVVAPKRILAFCRYADDTGITFLTKEQANAVKGRAQLNAENIVASEPDLVLASVATPMDLITVLDRLHIPIYIAASPKNYAAMRTKVLQVTEVVGEQAKGKEIVAKMDKRLAALEKKLKPITKAREKVVVAYSFSGPMGRRGQLFDDILTKAHVHNGAAVEGQGGLISIEQLVEVNPDILLMPTWNFDGKRDIKGYAREVMSNPALATIKAVKKKQIVFLPDKYRYVASQHVIDAIEETAKAIYPECF